ncbi:MAG: hypothetical protein H6766_02785 [Candidatus Peribacteria bacterium]|nr:MAG: hypothetical protein H6766_02785 [Candidatus Peribacteria bacterium]
MVTYHELGHAVTAHVLDEADQVEKISIVSRGQALGLTWKSSEEDTHLYSKTKMLHEVISLLGGRAAEEVWFGFDNITTGASNDFERATRIISDMVAKYGMDADLGPVMYWDKDKDNYTMFKPYSEKTGELIDSKIKGYLMECYDESKKILQKHKADIDRMADVLKAKEYLTKEEFETLMEDISQADVMLADYEKLISKEEREAAKAKKTITKKKTPVKKKPLEGKKLAG